MSTLISPQRMTSFLGATSAFLAIYVTFYDVFGGVIRYVLVNLHALFLNNLGMVASIGLFCAYLFVSAMTFSTRKFMLFLSLIISVYLIYALCDHLSFWQNTFGFYIWGGFLLGTLLCVYGREETFFKYMPVFWVCSVVGIFLNYCFDVPWVGVDYEMNGVVMQTARKWSGYGFERLAGFSRANYAAAAIIVVSYCYILASKKYSGLQKAGAYILTCGALFLSTSKTELAIAILLPAVYYSCRAIRNLKPGLDLYFARGLVVLMVSLVVLLPLALSSHETNNYSGPSYMFFTGETMLERTNGMWPEAFDLLEKDGNPLIGRGIGGVGIALGMKDPVPDSVNAADNLFVYVYVQAGLLAAIPFFLSFFLRWKKLYEKGTEYFDFIWLMAFAVLGVGITAGSIEDPLMAMLLGFLVARAYTTSTQRTQS